MPTKLFRTTFMKVTKGFEIHPAKAPLNRLKFLFFIHLLFGIAMADLLAWILLIRS